MKLNNAILRIPFYFFSTLIILIGLMILASYGWWFYAAIVGKGGSNGQMYIYYKDISENQFLAFCFIVSAITVFLMVSQVYFLIKKMDKSLIKSYIAFILFIVALTVWEQLKYVGKG